MSRVDTRPRFFSCSEYRVVPWLHEECIARLGIAIEFSAQKPGGKDPEAANLNSVTGRHGSRDCIKKNPD